MDGPFHVFTPDHNDRGDMTDDGQDHKHVFDAFGRLVKITDRTTPTPAVLRTFRYNGLGHRIAAFEGDAQSTTGLGDYFVYDDRWRTVLRVLGDENAGVSGSGEFQTDTIDSQTVPSYRELWVYHCAGLAGAGGSSYIDDVIIRESGTSATLGTRHNLLQNAGGWRGDVVYLVGTDGVQYERVRYSPYGTPYAYSFAGHTLRCSP